MDLLDPVLQSYPWGSRTHLARITGADAPTSKPWAELWFGAHALASATVAGEPLDQLIAKDPVAALGPASQADSGKLPFLLKLLAADEPLSLQAHPTLAEAQEGFANENAQGIPATAHFRNYRDDNHKPELIVALTEFDALAGFRPVARTKELFAQLAVPELDHYMGLLDAADDESGLRALFTTWLTLPQDVLDELVAAVAGKCALFASDDEEFALVAQTTCELARKYPGDPGVLGSMLLNRLRLQPGEAIFLGAGQLHAYLNGMGVEIMANSDNVLRGGLTSKHVDVVELLRVLSFRPLPSPVLQAQRGDDGWNYYAAPVREFRLCSRELEPGERVNLDEGSATIVLLTKGAATLQHGEAHIEVPCGHAAWVPAVDTADTDIVAGAEDAEVFVATIPHVM
ncbi:MAG: mannose-6-phosphate isomerase, class I [Corynebacterium sp.]|uniref:mannose-6-phosphate isomerase, class I n=1 Tax=Corynebacterium sp. TaxID=1720 RepID=UPI0026DDB962|nr:mannose-6-phosphate isomerase, class I [Corynebacterium sp.]MDO5030198.1 mannose-6-phosphate isomerase, class I [Corynebacterium sp.]